MNLPKLDEILERVEKATPLDSEGDWDVSWRSEWANLGYLTINGREATDADSALLNNCHTDLALLAECLKEAIAGLEHLSRSTIRYIDTEMPSAEAVLAKQALTKIKSKLGATA